MEVYSLLKLETQIDVWNPEEKDTFTKSTPMGF